MKKTVFYLVAFALFANVLNAKQVKFSVDMTGQAISPLGVHLTGDFQAMLGYAGGDWQANTTTMTQVGTTNVFSIVLNLPAFAKYEYKFVNGDQFYEAEFIPEPSRVGYDFNDNRWLYVDSTDASVTDIGAIIFATNAPMGKKMARFYVDMTGYPMMPPFAGIHLAITGQTAPIRLYSFGNNLYEIITFVDAANYSYKFRSNSDAQSSEIVPAACATNGLRTATIASDTLLNVVCFAQCTACLVATKTVLANNTTTISPNPAHNNVQLTINNAAVNTVQILDAFGRVMTTQNVTANNINIATNDWAQGIYFVKTIADDGQFMIKKLLIE
jgi:Secretion system C-terminal sorting domain